MVQTPNIQRLMLRENGPNPYLLRLHDFPGRLFVCQEKLLGQDREEIAQVVRAREQLVLEIGSGSGQHLIALALRNPEATHIGFELRFKRAVRTVEKAVAAGAANLFVCILDGARIGELFTPGSVDAVHINFPDPWQKLGQRKNRLLQQPFIDTVAQLLKPDGILQLKSDHAEYFAEARALLAQSREFAIEEESADLHVSDYAATNIRTEFEQLFQFQRKPIHYVQAVRATANLLAG